MFSKKMLQLLKWLLSASLFLANPNISTAGDVCHIPGAFADVGLGAGPAGMGGSLVVLGRDVYSIVNNPAGLISLAERQAAFSMVKPFALVPYNLVVYGQRFRSKYALGLGFLTSGDNALRENTVYVTLARILPLNSISVGLNLKYRNASFGNNSDGKWIYENGNRQVTGSANGFGFDLGIRGKLGQRIGYGLVLKDLFESISYNASNEVKTARGGSEKVPSTLLLGLGYIANKNLTFELDLNKALYEETNDRLCFGAENVFFSMFALRAGLSQNINAPEVNRNYALGFGLFPALKHLPVRFSLDFAYLLNEFQDFYHVGLKTSWGGE